MSVTPTPTPAPPAQAPGFITVLEYLVQILAPGLSPATITSYLGELGSIVTFVLGLTGTTVAGLNSAIVALVGLLLLVAMCAVRLFVHGKIVNAATSLTIVHLDNQTRLALPAPPSGVVVNTGNTWPTTPAAPVQQAQQLLCVPGTGNTWPTTPAAPGSIPQALLATSPPV